MTRQNKTMKASVSHSHRLHMPELPEGRHLLRKSKMNRQHVQNGNLKPGVCCVYVSIAQTWFLGPMSSNSRGSKPEFQGSVEVWSAFQLQGGLETRGGGAMGAAPQLSSYMSHRHDDLKDAKLPQRDAQQIFGGKPRKLVFRCRLPAYYLAVFQNGEWLQGNCWMPSYGFPRMLITDRARWTAEQLYKHRLVPGLVCLIKDGSVLRNAVIKLCGVRLAHMGSNHTAQ